MKRLSASSSELESDCSSNKRSVAFTTFQNWHRDFDRELKTLSWLDSDTTYKGGKKIITHLKCITCTKFESRIRGEEELQCDGLMVRTLFELAIFVIMPTVPTLSCNISATKRASSSSRSEFSLLCSYCKGSMYFG